MSDQKKLAALLRLLADRLDDSSLDELQALMGAKDTPSKRDRKPDIPERRSTDVRNWAQIADELRALATRDDGQEFLEKQAFTRVELERLARVMNLPVTKQDDRQRLKDKIVEFGIGARLNSQAIRGS